MGSANHYSELFDGRCEDLNTGNLGFRHATRPLKHQDWLKYVASRLGARDRE
jgi:hypothetical protein